MATAQDFPSAFPPDLVDLWDDFARSLRRRKRSDDTAKLYRRSYVRFWSWAISEGIDRPDDVTAADVNRWVDSLDAEGLAPNTVVIAWRNLRPWFSWWAKEFEAPHPFAGADVPGTVDEPPPVLDLDDVQRLLDACKGRELADRRDEAIVRILFDVGARRGELASLRLDGWDRRADMLTLRGKTGTRVVPISPRTGEALARYVRLRARHPKHDHPAMWLGRKGPLGDSGIAQAIARRCEAAGLPRINPHAFRHTFAHLYRVAGGSEGDLLYLAGWKSPAMAHRYGASARASRARDAARDIALGDQLT